MEAARDITYLTQDQLRQLFAVIKDKRDKALFYLAYHHGLRASEVSLDHDRKPPPLDGEECHPR